jgi:hypothetical protein
MINPQKQKKMKDNLDPKETALLVDELLASEIESIECLGRLQRKLGNYCGSFLLHEITDRRKFIEKMLRNRDQLHPK